MLRSALLVSFAAGALGAMPEVWLQFPAAIPFPGLPPFQPPDTEVSGTSVNGRDGGPAFPLEGVENAWIEKIPSFLRQAEYFTVPVVSEGGGLRFECPIAQPCTFFVMIFHCVPCSIGLDGGLPRLLPLSDGWEARKCAPVALFGTDPESYPMMAFRLEVAPMSSAVTPRFASGGLYIGVFATVGSTPFCEISPRPQGPFQAPLTRCSSSSCSMKPVEGGGGLPNLR
eukprot:TRINITY_DN736_c1_g1_i1.p1 TRINITY_DN736_c1_g1~~TRINITY_DN736_c1_g1_i1.p1  ORF type:complete len:245 (+),score=33.30 TRINITY_DN736_c1_g1_i1:55-735(+)